MTDVSRFYHDVIDDVINGVKDDWVEDGLDLQVLDELKKLWTTKLEETHVFDPEPTAQPAAQYLSLIQRSQVQLRPTTPVSLINTSVAVPVRQLNVASRMVVSSVNSGAGSAESVSLSVAAPGSLSNIRPHTTRTTDAVIPNNLTPSGAHLTQAQRFSQHPVVHGGLIGGVPAVIPSSAATTQLFPQHSRTVGSATIQSGATPQLAALPSGLTGHLVQIGQQTYLVPQTIVGLRQPGGSQLSISQILGAAAAPSVLADPSTFPKTQVDGAHDNEDTKFFDTPGSQQSASGPPSNQPPQSSGTNRSMAASDEDDDDDDDDFVAATPGFAPSSVHPHYPLQSRELTSRNGSQIDALPSETPLLSGPPTPMTPASVTPFGASTPSWKRPSVPVRDSVPPTPGRKRRRRSPSNVGDTDTDVDDYDDDDDESDIEDDVELITNATMTPAGHGADLEDEDEEPGSRNQRSPRHSRHLSTRNANVMPSSSRQLSSPGSQLGDVPPESQERSGGDSELLHGDEEDKEEEEDEEPLNSGDDVSDEEPEVLFESDNVVVCQYDKIQRSRNRWRFHLKDGIMVINGRDHVFQKAVGEAEW